MPIDLPEEFVDLVRDALLHLYDLAHLQTSPLLAIAGTAESAAVARGRFLRQTLLDAINALHPGPGTGALTRAWRSYRIVELRYIEGREVADVIEQVALGRRQYHREHHRALQAVASILWDRWQLASRWTAPPAPAPSERTRSYDLARLEAERLLLHGGAGHASLIDPAAVLRGVADLLRPLCAQRGVHLRIEIPEHLPAIPCDRVALRQALLTLFAHAVNATNGGTVEVGAVDRADRIEVHISGPAAGPVEPDRLGVEESRLFVESLKGNLTYFPPAGRPELWAIHLCFPASDRPVLLVVDNNADFVRLIEHYLAGHVWEVAGVSDVDQAFAFAQQRHPRAILLDVVIPDRDGWDLLLELKTTPATRNIPVIVCSVLDEPEVAVSLGAVAYLQKPVDQHHLVEALAALDRFAEHPEGPA